MTQLKFSSTAIKLLFCSILLLSPFKSASSTTPDVNIKTPPLNMTVADSTLFAKFDLNQLEIVVIAENAKVVVKHMTDIKEININASCPGNWNINQNVIRQAGFSQGSSGVAMKADALGSRAIVKGKVYLFPTGQVKGLKMGKDGVFVGGEQIQPLAGSNVNGKCTGFDVLEIQVPLKYRGGFKIGASGTSEISMDNWNSGEISCTLLEKSSFAGGKLDALKKIVIDNRGSGKTEIQNLSTKIMVVNNSGNGSVIVNKGSADMSNATVEGAGSITLKGQYKNMKKSIDGTGTIEILK